MVRVRIRVKIRVSDPRWIASSAHRMILWALEAIHQGSIRVRFTVRIMVG